MQTYLVEEAPLEMNFIQPSIIQTPRPSQRVHKRHCGDCGAGASRRAIYCSACGSALGIRGSADARRHILFVLLATVISAAVIGLFVMFTWMHAADLFQ